MLVKETIIEKLKLESDIRSIYETNDQILFRAILEITEIEELPYLSNMISEIIEIFKKNESVIRTSNLAPNKLNDILTNQINSKTEELLESLQRQEKTLRQNGETEEANELEEAQREVRIAQKITKEKIIPKIITIYINYIKKRKS